MMKHDDMIYEESLDHLQQEVNAGADFVITQMVFQADTLISFIKQCRAGGISVPIIPGILPIQVRLNLIREFIIQWRYLVIKLNQICVRK